MKILALQTHQVLLYDLCRIWAEHEVHLPVPEGHALWPEAELAQARRATTRSRTFSAARDQLGWLRSVPPNLRFLSVPGLRERDLLPAEDYHTYFCRVFEAFGSRLDAHTLRGFDVIYCMHWAEVVPELLRKTDRGVVLHFGGQAFRSTVDWLVETGLMEAPQVRVVSYSEQERRRFGRWSDRVTVIPFGKDPDDYGPHRARDPRVLIVNNNLYTRSESSPWLVRDAVGELPYRLVGVGNRGGECLEYADLVEAMRVHAVCLHMGVREVPYTLALIECLMTGMPVVARRYGDVDSLLESGRDALIGRSAGELNDMLRRVSSDTDLAARLGAAGRVRAIELFGIQAVAPRWEQLFDEMGRH